MLKSIRSSQLRTVKKGSKFLVRYVAGYFKKGRFTAPDKPRMSIETTNICNAKCVFCANPIMERRKEHLEMNKFKKAVDEFVAIGRHGVGFQRNHRRPVA